MNAECESPTMNAGAASEVRVDKWLWAVRVFKTRTAATDACNAGHVRIGDDAAKPAARVRPGDVVNARRGDRLFVLRVIGLLEKRVGATVAAVAYEDLSPAPEPDTVNSPFGAIEVPRRERGAGRPTKRDRRQTDTLRGRPA